MRGPLPRTAEEARMRAANVANAPRRHMLAEDAPEVDNEGVGPTDSRKSYIYGAAFEVQRST